MDESGGLLRSKNFSGNETSPVGKKHLQTFWVSMRLTYMRVTVAGGPPCLRVSAMKAGRDACCYVAICEINSVRPTNEQLRKTVVYV